MRDTNRSAAWARAVFPPRTGPGRGRRHSRRAVVALAAIPALVAGITAAGVLASGTGVEQAVAADTPFTITGHGNGHGRGMGQWGAYGYAKNDGWAAERIVAHYYGGATLATLEDAQMSVRLTGNDDRPLSVYSDAGAGVAGKPVGPGEAVTLTPTPGGGAAVVVTRGCGGEVLWQGAADHPWVDPIDLGPDRPANEHLKMCGSDAAYRGSLGVALDGDAARTVNALAVDDYLYGVVPAESKAEWADSGGAEALRAQAIAARSYAASENREAYARTCDTQDCQVYSGTAKEDPRTTEAVRSTHGAILAKDGKPVRAEFSASTGGHTAGGEFPPVEDLGDAISPTHNWSVVVTAGDIASAFGVGELQTVEVTARNNFGADGGRVTGLRVVGSDGTADVSGTEARSKLKLKSDWFSVTEGLVADAPPEAPAEPDLNSPGNEVDASPIDAKYRELGGRDSVLGAPLGPQMMLPNEAGVFRLYTGGVIVWTEALGTQVVDASVLREWLPDSAAAANAPAEGADASAAGSDGAAGAGVAETAQAVADAVEVPAGG
ncbi:SpoIID/LytB domain-containing protein [Rhodococcus sp. HNM0569]|uniref:SpoIID/LytB domain-containing protein n=1 Tax=Rhodococcus sp. HNM0569 TaxID=2716340 RepID=UPI00146E81E3|nr:SpoIID/LytB domain-containing protein [Rhodococcus sp. HNM0569]NLU84800.1 SpoIID/LytB domain-containing protein [Rhodococcus sp. HNM0569]